MEIGKEKDIEFKDVDSNTVLPLMLKYHYLHRRVATRFCFALYYQGGLVGMITYSPVRLTLAHSISNDANNQNTLELSRLYIKDKVSQTISNITSQFVSWSLRQLKQRGNWFIISFKPK